MIDYLDGHDGAIEYLEGNVDEPRYVPAVVLFELYQGELFSEGLPRFEQLRQRLSWVDVIPFGEETALHTGRLLDELAGHGRSLKPRDAMIAGTAHQLGATLVSSDQDLTTTDLQEVIDVETY